MSVHYRGIREKGSDNVVSSVCVQTDRYISRRIFSVLLRRANAIKVWDNAIKMPDQHKYE